MEQFKIRCSAIGQIMGVKGLGKTGETYVKNWYLSQLYGKQLPQIKSKYLSKGIENEAISIEFASKILETKMRKNNQHFTNDFLTGTPDIIEPLFVADIKNSWDFSTFPLLEVDPPNIDYVYQLQGYMALTKKKSAILIYTLTDTPEYLIEKEAYRKCMDLGLFELDFNVVQEFTEQMTYKNIPDNMKIKMFYIQYDQTIIDKIESRVNECREIIKTFVI